MKTIILLSLLSALSVVNAADKVQRQYQGVNISQRAYNKMWSYFKTRLAKDDKGKVYCLLPNVEITRYYSPAYGEAFVLKAKGNIYPKGIGAKVEKRDDIIHIGKDGTVYKEKRIFRKCYGMPNTPLARSYVKGGSFSGPVLLSDPRRKQETRQHKFGGLKVTPLSYLDEADFGKYLADGGKLCLIRREESVPATVQQCKKCAGTGRVKQARRLDTAACPACKGAGKIQTAPAQYAYTKTPVKPPKK